MAKAAGGWGIAMNSLCNPKIPDQEAVPMARGQPAMYGLPHGTPSFGEHEHAIAAFAPTP